MRTLALFSICVVISACGGKIDDGTDADVDAGIDGPAPPPTCKPDTSLCKSSSECCSGQCIGGYCGGTPPPPCTPNYGNCTSQAQCCSLICSFGTCQPIPPPPPPPCQPDGTSCNAPSQCCSKTCSGGYCGGPQPPPPPPPCAGPGAPCSNDSVCCSNVCSGNTCGGIACASTSTKLCDQCVAQSCCSPMITCGNDAACSSWLTCIQNCEQQGISASTCTQGACGGAQNTAEMSLYSCAQQFCSSPCVQD